jgi:hypothetical protein
LCYLKAKFNTSISLSNAIMIFPAKNFSYKGAVVGFIIGASIGLGMLNFSAFWGLGTAGAALFGFRNAILSVYRNKGNGLPVPGKAPETLS